VRLFAGGASTTPPMRLKRSSAIGYLLSGITVQREAPHCRSMLERITSYPRKLARKYCLTSNTIRYVIEYRCLVKLLSERGSPVELLVDLGAGSGEMSARLIDAGFARRGIAVEPFGGNFAKLKQRYSRLKESQCFNCSLETAPIRPATADLVLCTQVLEHIEDDAAAVARISEFTKPNGLVLISVPHPPEIFPNPGHVRPGYTLEELSGLGLQHGLHVLNHDYFFTLPTLRRMVAAEELGILGKLLPLGWADREAKLSTTEKERLQPYGLACLFEREC
jgi:SAM-dependent methyltransferase